MGLTQKAVAHLIGHRYGGRVSEYERGVAVPTLPTALRLEIVLRTPVAFLFPALYDSLKSEIRQEETRLAAFGQQALFQNP